MTTKKEEVREGEEARTKPGPATVKSELPEGVVFRDTIVEMEPKSIDEVRTSKDIQIPPDVKSMPADLTTLPDDARAVIGDPSLPGVIRAVQGTRVPETDVKGPVERVPMVETSPRVIDRATFERQERELAEYQAKAKELDEVQAGRPIGDIPLGDPYWKKRTELGF